MTMDYNKWGVVTGIVGLVLLLVVPPSVYAIKAIFFVDLFSTALLSIFLSFPFAILTLVLGVLSIWKGNKKKTALVLGVVFILLLILISIFLIYPSFQQVSTQPISVQKIIEYDCNEKYSACQTENDENFCREKLEECVRRYNTS